jgi:hypothetical protein
MLTRTVIREARPEEQAVAEARAAALAESTLGQHPSGIRLPWLALLLVPIVVVSQLLAPRNPANPVVGQGPRLLPRAHAAVSAIRIWGIWQGLQVHATLLGSYPDALAELTDEGILADTDLRDPWGRPYRFVLREDSLVLSGATRHGAPDPNLILTRQISTTAGPAEPGPGATLVEH